VLKHRPFHHSHGDHLKSRDLLKLVVIGDGNFATVQSGVRREVEKWGNGNFVDLRKGIVDHWPPRRSMEHRTAANEEQENCCQVNGE
jgi:hypothetical protein